MELEEAVERVRRLVQLGHFQEAEEAGISAPVPLAMKKSQLKPINFTKREVKESMLPPESATVSGEDPRTQKITTTTHAVSDGGPDSGLRPTGLHSRNTIFEKPLRGIERIEDSPLVPVENRSFLSPSSRVSFYEYAGMEVAVKFPKIATSNDLERFRREIIHLAMLNHPNIVTLVGACCLPPNYFFATRFCRGGSLEDALQRQGYNGKGLHAMKVIRMARDIAAALHHTHMHHLIHRDVKPANVLFDIDGRAVLADFGIAISEEEEEGESTISLKGNEDIHSNTNHKHLENTQAKKGRRSEGSGSSKNFSKTLSFSGPSGGFQHARAGGTMLYMAPEQLMGQHAVQASDVWAWAVMVNEALAGIKPYSDCNKGEPDAHTVLELGYAQHELSSAIVSDGLRPTMARSMPAELASILEASWAKNPSERPSFVTVLPMLQNILETLPEIKDESRLDSPARHIVRDHSSVEDAKANMDFIVDIELNGEELHWPRPSAEISSSSNGYTPQGVKIGSFETAGNRGEDRMEDRHILVECLGGHKDIHVAAIFDGHRGSEMAEFAQKHLLHVLRQHWHLPPGEALRSTFDYLDKSFRGREDRLHEESLQRHQSHGTVARRWPGATAICALLIGRHLWVANCGDCRAVLCQNGIAVPLTRDHTVDDEKERERIKAGGGVVEWRVNSWRVGSVGIQVTRSLGDGDLKHEGVIAEPEITHVELSESDQFVILASDGLWERVPNQVALGLVNDTVKQPNMCSQRLAFEAITAGSGDNVTVAVLFLQPADTIEKVYAAGVEKFPFTQTAFGTRSARAKSPTRAAQDELQDTY